MGVSTREEGDREEGEFLRRLPRPLSAHFGHMLCGADALDHPRDGRKARGAHSAVVFSCIAVRSRAYETSTKEKGPKPTPGRFAWFEGRRRETRPFFFSRQTVSYVP